jgi:uncharacterized membrane protein
MNNDKITVTIETTAISTNAVNNNNWLSPTLLGAKLGRSGRCLVLTIIDGFGWHREQNSRKH